MDKNDPKDPKVFRVKLQNFGKEIDEYDIQNLLDNGDYFAPPKVHVYRNVEKSDDFGTKFNEFFS